MGERFWRGNSPLFIVRGRANLDRPRDLGGKMTIVASIRNPVRAGSGAGANAPVPWRESFKRAIRSEAQLLEELELPAELLGPAKLASADFPLFVPREYVARMKKGDPRDPLLLQVLPLGDSAFTVTVQPVTGKPASATCADKRIGSPM